MKHFTIAAAIVALVAPFAAAQVVEESDAVWGAGSITRDVQQDLHFLDVTLSSGRSYTDVSAQFGPGGDFEGWRHATGQEVADLVTNWGFTQTVTSPANDVLGYEVYGVSAADELGNLLMLTGATQGDGVNFAAVSGFTSETITGDIFPGQQRIVYITDFFSQEDRIGFGTNPPGAAFTIRGHWLVRDAPAPSGLALFGSAALVGVRRRR